MSISLSVLCYYCRDYYFRQSVTGIFVWPSKQYHFIEFVVQSDMTVGVVEQTPKPHFSFDLQFQSCLFFFMSLGFTYHLDDKLVTNWPNEKVGLGQCGCNADGRAYLYLIFVFQLLLSPASWGQELPQKEVRPQQPGEPYFSHQHLRHC